MTSPLIPVGIATLGSLAVQTMSRLNPKDFLRELCGGDEKSAETTGPQPVAEPSLDLTNAIPAFIDHLRGELPAGANFDEPIMLKEDGWGGVVVDGDHPDRLAIEDLLASNATLREEFQKIADAATVQRDRALSPSFGEFRLRIEQDAASIHFE
jgi:hypothetical protein